MGEKGLLQVHLDFALLFSLGFVPSHSWELEFNKSVEPPFQNEFGNIFHGIIFACPSSHDDVSQRRDLLEWMLCHKEKPDERMAAIKIKLLRRLKCILERSISCYFQGREDFSLKASCQNAVSSHWSKFKFQFPFPQAPVQGAGASSCCSGSFHPPLEFVKQMGVRDSKGFKNRGQSSGSLAVLVQLPSKISEAGRRGGCWPGMLPCCRSKDSFWGAWLLSLLCLALKRIFAAVGSLPRRFSGWNILSILASSRVIEQEVKQHLFISLL